MTIIKGNDAVMMTFIERTTQGQTIISEFREEESQSTSSDYSQVLWIEISNPTVLERAFISQQEKIELPDHHELHQIEFSNQFYQENEAIFLTTNLVTNSYPRPENHAINIIVTKNKIITVRYSEPNPIKSFIDQIKTKKIVFRSHFELLKMLLQSFIGKNADILEAVGDRTNYLALTLSEGLSNGSLKKREFRLNHTLTEINLLENLISMSYQSLSSLEMLVNYFEQSITANTIELKNIKRDIFVLLKQGDYLNQKVVFQLDSTLGLINIEQMGIVKIFTVLAMVFMPPTLIASIYGMNFEHMPELKFIFGYPMVIVAIGLSALFPWIIFRKKGWI